MRDIISYIIIACILDVTSYEYLHAYNKNIDGNSLRNKYDSLQSIVNKQNEQYKYLESKIEEYQKLFREQIEKSNTYIQDLITLAIVILTTIGALIGYYFIKSFSIFNNAIKVINEMELKINNIKTNQENNEKWNDEISRRYEKLLGKEEKDYDTIHQLEIKYNSIQSEIDNMLRVNSLDQIEDLNSQFTSFMNSTRMNKIICDYRSGNEEERMTAMQALAQMSNKQSIPILIECASNKSNNENLRAEAIYGLGKRGSIILSEYPQIISIMLECYRSSNSNLKKTVIHAMKNIDGNIPEFISTIQNHNE